VTKKLLGKIYDARGDDVFFVNVTEDGDVVQIQQYDSIRHTYSSIDFFAATAPKLIGLIRQAAGVEVEYEYNIEETSRLTGEVRVGSYWGDFDYVKGVIYRRRQYEKKLADYTTHKLPNYTFKLIRRPVMPYEVVEED
jgi:hypothetical protein